MYEDRKEYGQIIEEVRKKAGLTQEHNIIDMKIGLTLIYIIGVLLLLASVSFHFNLVVLALVIFGGWGLYYLAYRKR